MVCRHILQFSNPLIVVVFLLPSRSMIGVVLEDGETGHVEFDSRGDRVGSLYDIVNVQLRSDCREHSSSCRSILNTVGKYGLVQVNYFYEMYFTGI